MSDRYMDIPFSQVKACADDILNRKLAKKLTVIQTGQNAEEVSSFGDGIEIVCEPSSVSRYVEFKMQEALDIPVKAVKKLPPETNLPKKGGGAEPLLSWPHDWQWEEMVKGHTYIPRIMGWKTRAIRYKAKEGPQTLVIRRGKYTVGLLRLVNGKIEIELTRDAEWCQPSLSDLTKRENLLAWLTGFLPSKEIIAGLSYRHGREAPDTNTEEGLFSFFASFGRGLPGGIWFASPTAAWPWEPSVSRIRPRISRSMPKFAYSLGFSGPFFPGQSMGFVLDCDRGLWDAETLSGHYYIPEKSYGKENIEHRIFSLTEAARMGLPTVSFKRIDEGEMKGLALSRFDVHCGRVLWRESKAQLGENWLDILAKRLPKKDREDFVGRMILGFIMGFDGTDFVLYELSPNVFPVNGPDGEGLCLEKTDRNFLRLAPFTGVKNCTAGIWADPEAREYRAKAIEMAKRLEVDPDVVDTWIKAWSDSAPKPR